MNTHPTLAEVQAIIEQLNGDDQERLADWLNDRVEPEMLPEEERELLQALDEADREIEEGRFIPIEQVLENLRAWRGK